MTDKEEGMKQKLRTTIVGFVLFAILSISVNAQTKDYGFTLKLNESKTSTSATKAGGSSFEKKFYASQESTTRPTGSTVYFSYHVRKNGKQVSNGLKLAEDDFKKHYNTYYSGKAIAGEKYKLYCKLTGSSSVDIAGVTGRWTP